MTRKRYGKYVSRVSRAPRNKKRYGGSAPAAAPGEVQYSGESPPEYPEDEDPDFLEILRDASEQRHRLGFGQHNALHINHGFDQYMSYVAPQNIDTKSMAEAVRDKHVGGGLDWDKIGKKIGHASVFAGEVGLAASGVAAFINPAVGAGMAAISAGAVGTGMAINHAYGEKMVSI